MNGPGEIRTLDLQLTSKSSLFEGLQSEALK